MNGLLPSTKNFGLILANVVRNEGKYLLFALNLFLMYAHIRARTGAACFWPLGAGAAPNKKTKSRSRQKYAAPSTSLLEN